MITLPSTPQSIRSIIQKSFDVWLDDSGTLFLISLLAIFIVTIPYYYLPEFNTLDVVHYLTSFAKHWAVWLTYCLMLVFSLSLIFIRLHQVMNAHEGGFRYALTLAVKRYPHALIGAIFMCVILFIGYLLAFFPGFILSVCLACYFPVLILQNKGPVEAFEYSLSLVWGNWWRTFATLGLSLVVFALMTFIIDLLAFEIWHFQHPKGEVWLGRNLFRLLFSGLTYPIYCAVVLMVTRDLEIRKADDRRDEEKEEQRAEQTAE